MGDRISIQFVNGDEKSVVFFSHWDGTGLLDTLKDFNADLIKAIDSNKDPWSEPLSRLEPGTVMVNFIGWLGRRRGDFTFGNYYLGATENDGDNSDNGHYLVNLSGKGLESITSAWYGEVMHF